MSTTPRAISAIGSVDGSPARRGGTTWYRQFMERIHAFGDDALGDFDAVGLVEAMRAGTVSSRELIEAAIARTEAVNPSLNGLAFEAFDRARARASSRRPYGGYFDGVPSFIKDNVAVAGMPTMQGTDAWDPQPAPADGDFAKVFLGTGLVPLGKSQMSEFGFCPASEHARIGPVPCPWNPEHTAGGSSSGSAVFVAAGAVPIAHGMDGGGSIRIPASCNGLVGLKPTRGRLPLDKDVRRMPLKVVHNGVLTRSVRDTAAFYREAEQIWRNRKLLPIGDVTTPSTKRLTVAVITRSLFRDASAEIRELTLKAAAVLEELGHRVEHLDSPPVPKTFADDFVLYYALLGFALVRNGRQMFGESFDRSKLDAQTLGFERYAARNLHRLPLALARLGSIRRRTAQFFSTYDVVLTPTLPDPAPIIGHFDSRVGYEQIIGRISDWLAYTPLQNATGEPAISLPLAESASGLPVGMMFATRIGHEARLIELAYELEEARPWARIQS
jgi:amidase